MTNINEIYPSTNSLKAADLKGRAVLVMVKDFEVREFQQNNKPARKIVLSFHGKDKTFVCNKTNAMVISASLGPDPQAWINHELELYPDKTMLGSELVDCIKVRVPVPAANPDDDIPF